MRRLNIKSLEFVPYGLTVDGSAARAAYAQHLQGYLAATLLPLFDAWEGELPEHLQKVRRCMPAGTIAPDRVGCPWQFSPLISSSRSWSGRPFHKRQSLLGPVPICEWHE